MNILLDTSLIHLARDIIRNEFINSITLRVTTVFFFVLITRILFAIYKYAIKMKNFYESRIKALELSGTSELERVKTFSEVLATDKIDLVVDDFGGSGLLEILKSAVGK